MEKCDFLIYSFGYLEPIFNALIFLIELVKQYF